MILNSFTRITPTNLPLFPSHPTSYPNFFSPHTISSAGPHSIRSFCLYHRIFRKENPLFYVIPEKRFSEIIDNAKVEEVERWLRPASKQFNIWYNYNSERYVPDFVVETADTIYLIEIKAEIEMEDRTVQLKAEAAINYCQTAGEINAARNEKP